MQWWTTPLYNPCAFIRNERSWAELGRQLGWDRWGPVRESQGVPLLPLGHPCPFPLSCLCAHACGFHWQQSSLPFFPLPFLSHLTPRARPFPLVGLYDGRDGCSAWKSLPGFACTPQYRVNCFQRLPGRRALGFSLLIVHLKLANRLLMVLHMICGIPTPWRADCTIDDQHEGWPRGPRVRIR